VCEITNGRFVEAKQEKSWLAVGPLWSNPAGGFGSAAGLHQLNLYAVDLPVELACHTAEDWVRHCRPIPVVRARPLSSKSKGIKLTAVPRQKTGQVVMNLLALRAQLRMQ